MSSVRGAGYSQRGSAAVEQEGGARGVCLVHVGELSFLPAASQGGLMESPRRGLAKGPAPPLEVKQEDR